MYPWFFHGTLVSDRTRTHILYANSLSFLHCEWTRLRLWMTRQSGDDNALECLLECNREAWRSFDAEYYHQNRLSFSPSLHRRSSYCYRRISVPFASKSNGVVESRWRTPPAGRCADNIPLSAMTHRSRPSINHIAKNKKNQVAHHEIPFLLLVRFHQQLYLLGEIDRCRRCVDRVTQRIRSIQTAAKSNQFGKDKEDIRSAWQTNTDLHIQSAVVFATNKMAK